MKTDINGCSTCKAGSEQYETFTNRKGRVLYQYDYRHPNGELFSGVGAHLESCRDKRDYHFKMGDYEV